MNGSQSGRSADATQAIAELAAIVELSDDAIISKTLDGVITQWNRGAENIFGYTAREAVGRKINFIIPEDRPDEEAEIQARLRRGEAIKELETVRIAKDGRRLHVVISVSAIKDASGQMIGALKVARDVTERKLAGEEQQRQAQFDLMITKILTRFAGSAVFDRQIQKSLYEVSAFMGVESAFIALESPDTSMWRVVYESAVAGAPTIIPDHQNIPIGRRPWVEQRILAGEPVQIVALDDFPKEAAAEREIYERAGVKSTLLLPLRGRGEQVTGYVGLRMFTRTMAWSQEDVRRLRIFADAIANVLERKRVENDLYESRQMLQRILDTIPQRVFWKDLDSQYMGCNKPFALDAGVSGTDAVVGRSDHDFPWHGEHAEKYRADDRMVMETGVEKIGMEEPQQRSDGSVAWVRTSKMPLRDQQDRIFGVLGTYEDITGERLAREALEQAKAVAEAANRAKDQFIAVLSHELRTPLTPVLAMVTAIEEMENLPPRVQKDLEVIHRNVELEARLIDDLLDVTRISQGKVNLRQENVDAHACFHSALEICESELEARQMKVSLDLAAAERFVWGDPVRLRQVFWNLLNNALKFSPRQGRIRVRTWNDGDRLKIEIADEGIGIDEQTMQRIFQAFEQGEVTRTRRFGGLGLGLSIAKALVEMHQGRLSAFSDGRNKGASFIVELISIPAAPRREQPVETAASGVSRCHRILLVEDHEDTLHILARFLRKWGYRVTTASTVQSALERASEQNFDLLISDLGLPDGSGHDVARELQRRCKLPAIALSGYGTDVDIQNSLEAGFAEHLTKPISFQGLRGAIERLLAG